MGQIQKREAGLAQNSVANSSTALLLNSIRVQDDFQISSIVSSYIKAGTPQFALLLQTPLGDRIPGLAAKYGSKRIHALIVILVTNFCNNLNLIRPMTESQIVSCSFELMNTASEDQLSIEDLTVFFNGAVAGKYGRILDRMDQQILFELLENYRQERHISYSRLQEERHIQLKSLGPIDRSCEDQQEIRDLFRQANVDYLKNSSNGSETNIH
jgi:hypothetical protein